MRLGWSSVLVLVSACQRVEPTGDFVPPSRPPAVEEAPPVAPAAAPAATPPPAVPAVPAAPAADLPPAAPPAGGAMSDAELLAVAMGLDPAAAAATAGTARPPPDRLPLPAAPPAPDGPPAWTPDAPLDGSWGVRLVSVVADAQPPRAILGLPDGREVVVEPGAFIERERLVVTAIGRDALQLVHVIPVGDHVRVESETLRPLYGRPADDGR